MVPAHFHDVDGDLSDPNVGKIFGLSKILILPAHFHDVTYDHIWSKILQELTKGPARNTRAILKSVTSNAKSNTSIARV